MNDSAADSEKPARHTPPPQSQRADAEAPSRIRPESPSASGEDDQTSAAQRHDPGGPQTRGAHGGEGGDSNRQEEREGGQTRPSRVFLWGFVAFGAAAGAGLLVYHELIGRYHVTTDDAYVNGDLVRIQPQVSGTVTLITTDETQPVRRGQLLFELDPHDAEVALERAEANLAETVRDVEQLFANEKRQEAIVAAQRAQLIFADEVLHRDRMLIATRGVSEEDLERTQENARDANAGLRQALATLQADRAAIAGTEPQSHPRVLLAESNLRAAWLALDRTRVLAPVSGYMVQREVQLGQQVTPATELAAIAPLDNLWIEANFKETRLKKLRIGQPVSVTADIYGSAFTYHGRVLGLTAGTGAALSVLPPENATGNWIKIVQRLPVRIGLNPRELRAHPLFLGLSTSVDVDVHDTSGPALSRTPAWPAELQTDVYAGQEAGVDAQIKRILRENLLVTQTTEPAP